MPLRQFCKEQKYKKAEKQPPLWRWTTVNQLKACSMNNSSLLFFWETSIYAPEIAKEPPFKLFLSSNLSISSGDKENGEKNRCSWAFHSLMSIFPLKKQLLLI